MPLVADGTISKGNLTLRWAVVRRGQEGVDSRPLAIPARKCFRKVRREPICAPFFVRSTVKLPDSFEMFQRSITDMFDHRNLPHNGRVLNTAA